MLEFIKRFIGKILLFTFLIALTSILIMWVLIPTDQNAYQARVIDKIAYLARTPSPKIILVGGSNLAFSMDSERLADSLGYPVANLGLAKSVGLRYMLQEVKPYIGPGDLILLAPEYELYFDLFDGSEGLVVLLQYYPGAIKSISSWAEVRTIAENFGLIMQMKFNGFLRTGDRGLVDEVYRRDGFNESGDVITHLDLETDLELRNLFEEDVPFHEEAIDIMNTFARHAETNGAHVYLTCPALLDQYYRDYHEKIEALYERLDSDLSFPVISSPSDYTFPMEQMFDTPYHLLREGRRQRTDLLIRDVRRMTGSR